jgi:hypothetical protein
LRHSRHAEYSSAKAIFPPKEEESHVDQINAAIATLGLGSPAFAASYGGYPMTPEV